MGTGVNRTYIPLQMEDNLNYFYCPFNVEFTKTGKYY